MIDSKQSTTPFRWGLVASELKTICFHPPNFRRALPRPGISTPAVSNTRSGRRRRRRVVGTEFIGYSTRFGMDEFHIGLTRYWTTKRSRDCNRSRFCVAKLIISYQMIATERAAREVASRAPGAGIRGGDMKQRGNRQDDDRHTDRNNRAASAPAGREDRRAKDLLAKHVIVARLDRQSIFLAWNKGNITASPKSRWNPPDKFIRNAFGSRR